MDEGVTHMDEGSAHKEQDPALVPVRTYGYLRLALAGLVLLLYSAIVIEWWAAGASCVQTSISAYFHTPVQSVFVGVLVTMGVCLIALKGNTNGEDILLNLAGMLAPVVAFVPTKDRGDCRSVLLADHDVAGAVANNMQALFVAGVVVAVVALVLAVRQSRGAALTRTDRLGVLVAAAVMTGGVAWFYVSRSTFVEHAHDVAAVPMFLAIVAVAWLNGRDVRQAMSEGVAPPQANRYVRIYKAISMAMLAALALTIGVSLLTPWEHAVFWVEVVLITLFAIFWLVQTKELWRRGLRGVDVAPLTEDAARVTRHPAAGAGAGAGGA